MREFRLSCAAAAAALAAIMSTSAQAAEPADGKSETIVVTATVDREIEDFFDAVIDVSNFKQVGRFEKAICPIAAGIPQSQKQAVVERMRIVANAAGIRSGNANCRPNVLVLVTADRKGLVEKFAELYPQSMRDLSKAERRALVESTEPAVAWHMEGPIVDSDGVEIGEKTDGVFVNRVSGSATRLTSLTRPQFDAAVVVIDSAELVGLTTTQLADYAAMRAFLKADPAKLEGSSMSTILRILHADDNSEVPVTLTEWDMSALKGFYDVNRNVPLVSQRSAVRKQIKDKVGGGEDGRN